MGILKQDWESDRQGRLHGSLPMGLGEQSALCGCSGLLLSYQQFGQG